MQLLRFDANKSTFRKFVCNFLVKAKRTWIGAVLKCAYLCHTLIHDCAVWFLEWVTFSSLSLKTSAHSAKSLQCWIPVVFLPLSSFESHVCFISRVVFFFLFHNHFCAVLWCCTTVRACVFAIQWTEYFFSTNLRNERLNLKHVNFRQTDVSKIYMQYTCNPPHISTAADGTP